MLHDHVSGLLRILEAAPGHTRGGGQFGEEPEAAVKAFAHVYAGCGLSQDFYRERLFETALRAPDLETILGTDWEDSFARSRVANLHAQARTWLEADISAVPAEAGCYETPCKCSWPDSAFRLAGRRLGTRSWERFRAERGSTDGGQAGDGRGGLEGAFRRQPLLGHQNGPLDLRSDAWLQGPSKGSATVYRT